ncbi:hypothetical protein KFZ56_12205 [Virgibacillus sp. NKC19-3]|uniref:hypothetical protein n=1 Tax=Virgibacillus saliphilus TaxID=2831674 RepID=UPI001C9AF1B5|nr:hypothetical protein [Virgibacillus sp. NKC19-3]MBY7143794.1 hypothetical protein [Virgibacillus sp. NKC19-3]
MFNVSWINLSRFTPLGVREEHIYVLLIAIGIITSYLVVQPFITWFVAKRSAKLLSYIISSLLVIISCFIVVLFIGDFHHLRVHLLKITLQTLAVFGVVLILFYSYRRLMKTN